MISIPPRLLMIMLPLLLTATWFVSLIMFGNLAQYEPFVLFGIVLASLFCLGLIRRNKNLILFLLSAAVILISVSFRTRPSGEVGLDFQNGYKMAIWAVCLFLTVCNIKRILPYFRDPIFLIFGAFLLCNIVSSIYSPVPMISLAGALGTLAYMGLALVVVALIDERKIMITLLMCLFIYCMLNLLSLASPETSWFLTDPTTGIYRFMGVSGQPNTLSRNCSIFLIFILCAYSRGYIGGRITASLSLLAFGLAMMTQSRTPIVSLVFALLLQLPRKYLLSLGLLIGAVISFIWFSGLIDTILAMVGRDGNVDEALTMSGRTELWSWVWDQIQNQPLIGHGYNSFESFAGDNYPVGADKGIVRITHNAYLDVLYSTGFIGATFFVTAFLIMIFRWWTRPNFGRDLAVWSTIFVGITEVELSGVSILPPLMLFLMLAFDTKEFRLCNR